MSERSFWSRSYQVIEKGTNIFGFLSALIWIWALVFPAKAVSVLESYEARFCIKIHSFHKCRRHHRI
ncbi:MULTISPECIES: hypothetical protein [Rhodobacterales]|uniref:hypothetical protein n=1 Tax=Ascidiaceihabitans sp. TaxID=1872644 RepID=UPI00329A4DF6